MIGFWTFCLCLFWFVNKRAGAIAGSIAMLLPTLSGAFFYAYEARPYGLVMGFCGLALLCWQSSLEQPQKKRWLICFSLALFAAFFAHCYAVVIAAPFAVTELLRSARLRSVEYRRWIALAAPVVFAGFTYLPLIRSFRSAARGTTFTSCSSLVWSDVGAFYVYLLAPCIVIVLLIVVILGLTAIRSSRVNGCEATDLMRFEVAFAVSLLALPAFGMLLAKVLHSQFCDRYFLPAVGGLGILAGFGALAGKPTNRLATLLAGVMAFLLFWNLSMVIRHRSFGWAENLVEPSSHFSANSSLTGPLSRYSLLLSGARKGERIVVLWPIDFLYLVNYAPELRPQLYYLGWIEGDPFYRLLGSLEPYAPFPYHVISADKFFASRSDFMYYGLESDPAQMRALTGDAIIRSLRSSSGRFLAEVHPTP